MRLFRDPKIMLMGEVDPSFHRVVIIMEPEKGDIRRLDFTVPAAESSLGVINLFSKMFDQMAWEHRNKETL